MRRKNLKNEETELNSETGLKQTQKRKREMSKKNKKQNNYWTKKL